MSTRTLEHAKMMRITRLLRQGTSMREIARIVGASFNTVAKYKRRFEATTRQS